MIPGDTLLDAFIDANILFVLAFALWSAVRFAMRRIGVRHAYSTELNLLNGVFVAILISPLIVMALGGLQSSGLGKGVNVNLSDMVVSHFLNGGFEMKASEFEQMLLMRESFVQSVVNLADWTAYAAIAAFLAGVAIGSARLAVSVFCLHRIVAQSYAWRNHGRLRIRLSDRVTVPFSTRGLRYYYVVIPSQMLGNKTDLAVSLAHEFQHIRQGDIDWEIVLELLKPVFFLNPAYHAWKRKVEDLRELSCDSAVLNRGRIGMRDYCDTLLSVCQQTLRRDRVFAVAVPKVTLVTADRSALRPRKASFLERRVTSILSARSLRHPRLVFGIVILPLAGAILLAAVAIQSPGDWSHDRLMLSTVVNLERLDEINRATAVRRLRD